jgi:nitrite reductase (NO-forming)
MKTRKLIAFAAAAFFGFSLITSCGGGKTTTQATTDSTNVAGQKETPAVSGTDKMALGKNIFETKCIVCHQPDGKGLKPSFPPLAGSDYLLADKKRAVAQALNGSDGEITVNGEKYKGLMPQQVGTHEEAVAVINYVLNNFGNSGGTVTVEEVKDVVINPRK